MIEKLNAFVMGLFFAALMFFIGFICGYVYQPRTFPPAPSYAAVQTISDRQLGEPQWFSHIIVCERTNGAFSIPGCRREIGGPYSSYDWCMLLESGALDMFSTIMRQQDRPVLVRFSCVAEYDA